MGRPKAFLPWGERTMLAHVVARVAEVTHRVVVVAAVDQEVPPLPPDVPVVRDDREAQGPLAGLAAGLRALASDCEAAFLSSCDVPFLAPSLVRHLLAQRNDYEVVVPRDGTFHHPTCAVYQTGLVSRIEGLLDAGERRPLRLIEASRSLSIPVTDLEPHDPGLRSFRNLNHPEDYTRALADAGWPRES